MVLDPLIAVGLAGNIVQLVEFAAKVVKRLDDFDHRRGETPKLFRGISTRLPLLIDILNRSNGSIKPDIPQETQKACYKLLNACLAQTKALNEILDEILPQEHDSWTTKKKKALHSLTRERAVEKIEDDLRRCVDILTFHHVVLQTGEARLDSASDTIMAGSDIQRAREFFEVPRRRVPYFVGREAILAEIERKFANSSTVVLQGMGGQGKTQIALEYCHRSRQKSRLSVIFWVDASSEKTFKRSFETIAEIIKPPGRVFENGDQRIAYVKSTFSSWSRPWLFVFDNYDDPALFPNSTDFIPSANDGTVLFTSRHVDVSYYGAFIKVSGMSQDEAIELLFSRTAFDKSTTNIEHATQIVERLGYHPLALDQAAAYIRKRGKGLPLGEFLDHYQRRKRDILKQTPKVWEYRKQLNDVDGEISLNVFTAWELSFEQINREGGTGNRISLMLCFFAFLCHNHISENLFAVYHKAAQSSSSLLSWVDIFVENGEWIQDKFEDALIQLHDLALIEVHYKGPDNFIHVSIHPLVKDWIRLRASREEGRQQSLLAATILKEYLSNRYDNKIFWLSLEDTQAALLHVMAHEENYSDFLVAQPGFALTPGEVGQLSEAHNLYADFLKDCGRYKEARTLLQRELDLRLRAGNSESPDMLDMMKRKGIVLTHEGKYQEAEMVLRQVLDTQQRKLGEDNPVTLETLSSIAELLQDQGNYAEAETIYRQIAMQLKAILGMERPETLYIVNNLALVLREQSKQPEAEIIYRQVLEIRYKVYGPEHPHTLINLHNLAIVLTDMGKFKDSEALNRNVLELRKKTVGLQHPRTLESSNNLGFVLCELGRYVEAEELNRQTLQAMEAVAGKEHPNTMHTLDNLAIVLLRQERVEEAMSAAERALGSREKILGKCHPHTLRSLNSLALVLHAQARHDDAERVLRHVLEARTRILGTQSHFSLASQFDLASVLRDQGKFQEAEELFLSTWRTREAVLGKDHPHTLATAVEYALLLDAAGQHKEAVSLLQNAREGLLAALDARHPLIQRCEDQLARSLEE